MRFAKITHKSVLLYGYINQGGLYMKKTFKFIWIGLVFCLLLSGLVSCKDKSEGSSNTEPAAVDDEVIYSPYVNTAIILGEGIEEADVSLIRSTYYKKIGKEISIATASSSASHEIIVGKTDRELSERAYRYLEGFKANDEYVGYVIYSDGRSVAIAFDEAVLGENVAFAEAIECFASEYMQAETLKLDSGAVCTAAFDAIEKQSERDEENIERTLSLKLSQISTKINNEDAADDILNALNGLRLIFNDNHSIVKWLANLYDPETGGFYYSNSARNNEGYLPDLESTSQAIGIIESILIGYGGTLTDYFGEEIASAFVSFARSMQDPNGYFYHPQWSRTLVDSSADRRSRDLLNALNILEYFGAAPVYDTPNGVKGDGVTAAASNLSTPLSMNKAVSAVKAVSSSADDIYIPSYLKSKDDFETYLSGLNIKSDPLAACETLSSEISLYIAIDEILEEQGASYRLCSLLYSYLTRLQNTSTGLWSYGGETIYEELSKLAAVVNIYNGIEKSIPKYEVVLNTLYNALQFEEEVDEITDISYTWSAVAVVVSNITSYGTASSQDQISYYLSLFYDSFADYLTATKEKLSLFLRDDGSFSTTPSGSASSVLGMPVAVPLMDEGDMNATLIATNSIWLAIFRSLDIGNIPIFTTADRMMFQKTLFDMGIIIKNEVKKTAALDFENTNIGDTSDVTLVENSNGGAMSEVVASDYEHGNVLRLYSPPDRTASSSDKFLFEVMSNVTSATCFSYELDMCVLDESDAGSFAYLYIYSDAYAISLNRNGDTISFYEESSAKADYTYTQDLGIRASVGEWFNIRVEYYFGTAETVRIKIYFNGECVAVTDNYYDYYAVKYDGLGTPVLNCTKFGVYGLWGMEMNVLVDNIIVEKTYQTYTQETSTTLNRNVDAPYKDQTVYDFESSLVDSTPLEFEVGGSSSAVKVTTDADNNKLLSISETAGEVILPLEQIGSGINSALIEFDLTISADSAVGAKYQINFNEYLCKGRCFGAMQLLILEENGSKYAALAEVVSGKTGTIYSDTKLSTGVKYHISLRIFFEESAIVVSVDDTVVGISANVLSGCKKYYMGETSIEALTSSVKSTIFIDNLVSARIRSDFEEVTAPDIDRTTYTFDDTGTADMELTGLSPYDGLLYFDGAGVNKSIKIPVTTRVNAPNMALIGFDVSEASGTSGDLVISLSDKNGNIIAAFELVTNGSSVGIYEHTKNGRYSAPMHTVSKINFNFEIEYSPAQESFNLLVDGAYVAASSLTYTLESGAYDFEYLTISTVGSSAFAIDNLFAEQICGIFKAQRVSMENTDSESAVITYETSSFASLPTIINYYPGSTSSYFKIREGSLNGAVSKVLEFNTVLGSSDYAQFTRTSTTDNSNAAYFETDMMLKMTSDVSLSTELTLQSKVTGTPTQYSFKIVASTKGGALKLTATDFNVTLDVTEGEWFKLRFEYRDTPDDFNYDGYNDCLVRAYVNDVLIGEGHTAKNTGAVQSYTTVRQLRFAVWGTSEGKVYFDNTALGQCTMDYEKPIPADTDTLTFSPGIITNMTRFTFGKTTSTAAISEMTVNGEVNKVLNFYTSSASTDKLTLTPTLTNENANAITFETDIMIAPTSNSATIYLEPITSDENQAFRLIITATKDGDVTISSADIEETVIGKSGEWIHLKVDYMNPRVDYDGDRRLDILYKVYVGEGDESELKATGYKPYSTGSRYDPLELSKYLLTATSASVANIYFDNTRFWQTELIPDEAPEFDYSEEDCYGSSGSDDNGWVN